MKKIIKKVLIGLGLVILLIVLFFGWYMIKAKSEIKKMTPLETKELVNHVYSIGDSFSNLYLIKDSDQYIAVDAGNSLDNVSNEIKKLSINPDKIIAVFLTHTDGDHVAALKLLKQAKIYLSKQEEQMINGATSRFLFFGNKINDRKYSLVEDQQTLTIGNTKVKGILTPGHTPGSMCYLINGKYLFTGDALSIKAGKIDKFNNFFNMDTETATKSMSNITHISDAEYIFSAHYGYAEYKNAVADWHN